jgi:photosystem II stability/assembly factor-like uncharacterized protein
MQSWSGRILSLARGADSARMYAGNFAGVWRSEDAGRTWRQLTWPQPPSGEFEVPGALFGPYVHSIAVSPVDPDLVLAATRAGQFSVSRDGLYRSVDGGATWRLVLQAAVSQVAFAPDDSLLVFAAAGANGVAVSTDAGANWTEHTVSGVANHLAVAPQEAPGVRWVYAAGDNRIFVSSDGGGAWDSDAGAADLRTALDEIWFRYAQPDQPPTFAGGSADSNASAAQILAIEPGRPRCVYLAAPSGANGPGFYTPRSADGTSFPDGTIRNVPPAPGAAEGSLWIGDFDGFELTGRARWAQLPGPPLYHGVTTPSGTAYVITHKISTGYLVFFGDCSHVHVTSGRPTAASSWHRLDGMDVAEAKQKGHSNNQIFMHPDPHALELTGDFEIKLKPPSGVSAPYDSCRVLDQHLRGDLWLANDGGVVFSEDGGRTWTRALGLETLDAVNLAGLYRTGRPPALFMGTVDNDDFFTLDGGQTWRDAAPALGDADAIHSDPAMPTRVLEFAPRAGGIAVFTSRFPLFYPDAGSGAEMRMVPPPPKGNASSSPWVRGFRPVIQTLAGEAPLDDGDYVFIAVNAAGERTLVRTRSISSITSASHWDDVAKAEPIGPPVPGLSDVVQVGGGHAAPVYYVSDGMSLFKLDATAGVWRTVVPGGPSGRTAGRARRFYVHPYNPEVVYVLDFGAIRVSPDGGESWLVDESLTEAATAGGRLSLDPGCLRDMVFVRDEPFTIFALGNAGVSYTLDGVEWRTLVSSLALPGRPEGGFFDPVGDQLERALYVVLEGRGVMRISPVPTPPGGPAQGFGLLEFAALEY